MTQHSRCLSLIPAATILAAPLVSSCGLSGEVVWAISAGAETVPHLIGAAFEQPLEAGSEPTETKPIEGYNPLDP